MRLSINKRSIIYILFFSTLLFSCEEDPIPSTPITIDNVKSISVNYTSSTIQFSITGNVNKAGVMYGMEKELSNAQIQYAEKANGEISVSLNGLEQGTEYFYKVFAEDKKGNRMFSEIKNLITLSPSVKTGDATEITTNKSRKTKCADHEKRNAYFGAKTKSDSKVPIVTFSFGLFNQNISAIQTAFKRYLNGAFSFDFLLK